MGRAKDLSQLPNAIVSDSSGNVGIGTGAPTKKFVVSNGGAAGLEIDPFTRSATLGTSLLSFNRTTSAYVRADYDALEHVFLTEAVERARIRSDGNLLVGTAGQFWATDIRMHCTGDKGAAFRSTGGAASEVLGVWNEATSGTRIQIYFADGSSGVIRGSITTNGSATAYNTSSDYRLKDSIAPMTGALDVVQQLKPVTYRWKESGESSQGFIAHELQQVVPECVTGEKDAVDADGKPVYQGIDTSFLVATLVAAIQELKSEFDAYKATHP
jgi:hypothetical protein